MPLSSFDLLNSEIGVSRETFDRLTIYHDLLLKWQNKINLVSDDTIPEIWRRHYLDSLQLLKYLPQNTKKVIDLGSGGGFPGMVISICTDHEVHLVESDVRKSVFLKEVARVTGAKCTIHQKRVEEVCIDKIDFITSRACADLTKLLTWSSNFVSHETICLFHKGKNYANEIRDAHEKWKFDFEAFPSITDEQSAIIKVSNLKT